MRRLVPFFLFASAFALPPLLFAVWFLLEAPQPPVMRLFGWLVVTLAGLWNLARGWDRLGRRR